MKEQTATPASKPQTATPSAKSQGATPAPKPFFGSAQLIAAKKKRAAQLKEADK